MTERPTEREAPAAAQRSIVKIVSPTVDWYRQIYRAVGADWLWWSRLAMDKKTLASILQHPDVQIYALREGERDLGLLELDYRTEGDCELAFLGLVADAIGTGGGRILMEHAIATAWSRPINRFWVHTCTLDDPRALGFYRRSGFSVVRQEVEIAPDPRLIGLLPESAAPHVPILR